VTTTTTTVVSGFPGVGKTHAHQNVPGLHIVDSDSSKYSWLDDGVLRNPNFPGNYIRRIRGLIGVVDVVLVSSHKEVRDALVANHIPFVLVYPQRALKQQYLERFRQRGSNEAFVKLLDDKWDEFLDDVQEQDNCEHVELGRDRFLSDVLLENVPPLRVQRRREPRFQEGQEVTFVETTVVAVGNQNALYFTFEPDEHVGTVLNPNVNTILARHDEPTVFVSFEMTGIGPAKTSLGVRLGEDMLKPVDAETLGEAVEKLASKKE
jgi:hypothetical protein